MDTPTPHLYESLATRLSEAIHAGTLRAGDRLPSVRRLSTQHRVSIATAVQAYRHLENQRLIEARPKSGYFVLGRTNPLAEPAASRPPAAPRFVGVTQLVMEVLESSRDANAIPLFRKLDLEASWRHDQYSDAGRDSQRANTRSQSNSNGSIEFAAGYGAKIGFADYS